LIASWELGLDGQLATECVEEEVKLELDLSLLLLPMEEKFVMPPSILKLAIPNLAQLTASWEIGANGLHVTRLAEKEPPPDQEALPFNPNTEERFVIPPSRATNATHNNAHKTVLFKVGALGQSVIRHVEEVYLLDNEKS